MGLFGCRHEWYPVAVFHYRDISYGSKGIPSTTVTSRCLKCGVVEDKTLYGSGYLNLSDLQSAPTKFAQPSSPKGKILKLVK